MEEGAGLLSWKWRTKRGKVRSDNTGSWYPATETDTKFEGIDLERDHDFKRVYFEASGGKADFISGLELAALDDGEFFWNAEHQFGRIHEGDYVIAFDEYRPFHALDLNEDHTGTPVKYRSKKVVSGEVESFIATEVWARAR